MTPEELQEIFRKCWSRETSGNCEGWMPENPAWMQCAVTMLVARDLLGGQMIKGQAQVGCISYSHYWNQLPDGQEIDFTKEQFSKDVTISKLITVPKKILSSLPSEFLKRYSLLKFAVENQINPNPLFSNENYRLCFEAAQASECQKMKFGCLVVYNEKVISAAANKFIEPLKHLCEPECIRLNIQSRTESMIGACGHAEEWALKEIFKQKIDPKLCSFYVAGFDSKTNSPWIRKDAADFTCLRCATQLYMAGLGKIFVPFIDRWESLTPEEAVRQSAVYALKEKKITD